jgi:hypothetical protein
MRISLCNWRTTEEDIAQAVGAVGKALAVTGSAVDP